TLPERLEPDVAPQPLADGGQLALEDLRHALVLRAAIEMERDLQASGAEPQLVVLPAVVVEDLEHAAHPRGLVVAEVRRQERGELLRDVAVEVPERRDVRSRCGSLPG